MIPPSPTSSQTKVPPLVVTIGMPMNTMARERDRQHRARHEEIADRTRIIDAGLHQPAPQHLHVVVGGV